MSRPALQSIEIVRGGSRTQIYPHLQTVHAAIVVEFHRALAAAFREQARAMQKVEIAVRDLGRSISAR